MHQHFLGVTTRAAAAPSLGPRGDQTPGWCHSHQHQAGERTGARLCSQAQLTLIFI